jgi:hypothetical protein
LTFLEYLIISNSKVFLSKHIITIAQTVAKHRTDNRMIIDSLSMLISMKYLSTPAILTNRSNKAIVIRRGRGIKGVKFILVVGTSNPPIIGLNNNDTLSSNNF